MSTATDTNPRAELTARREPMRSIGDRAPDDVSMQYPAWMVSLLLHAAMLTLFLLWWHFTAFPPGADGQWNAIAGIALVENDAVNTISAENSASVENTASDAANDSSTPAATSDSAESPTIEPRLPSPATPTIGATMTQRPDPAAALNSAVASETSSGASTGTAPYSIGDSSRATVNIFGTSGTGHRFVFVLDRSESMMESNARPLRAAKEELMRAIRGLDEMQQFNLIVYNDEMLSVFPNLVAATDSRRETVGRFLDSVVPRGATRHETPLVAAMRMGPDVIFLLTDATSDVDLTAAACDRLLRLHRTAEIHLIQFGRHQSPQLKRIVRATGGQSVQVGFDEE